MVHHWEKDYTNKYGNQYTHDIEGGKLIAELDANLYSSIFSLILEKNKHDPQVLTYEIGDEQNGFTTKVYKQHHVMLEHYERIKNSDLPPIYKNGLVVLLEALKEDLSQKGKYSNI